MGRVPQVDSYRIVLADDHVMLRQGVKKILDDRGDLEIVGETGDGLELLGLLKKVPFCPHMVILDISMPHLHGIEATRYIKKSYPGMKVLILTIHKEKEYFRNAISAGADGYLLKEEMDAELFDAIEVVRRGEVYISPSLQGNDQ